MKLPISTSVITSVLMPVLVFSQQLEFGANELVPASDGLTGNKRPRVAFDESGTAHLVWAVGGFSTGQIMYSRRQTNGDYMNAQVISGDTQGWGVEGGAGPTVKARSGYVAAGWDDGNRNNRGIWGAKSMDGGLNWEDPVRADNANPRNRYFPSIEIFPDGRMANCWLQFTSGWSDPFMAWTVQNDSGDFIEPIDATMLAPEVVCECCYPDQIILDDGETVLLAFRNNENNLREIHVARSVNGGQTFSEDHRVDHTGWIINGCPATGPHLAADGDHALLTFMSAADGTARMYAAKSTDGGATWEPEVELDAGGAGAIRNYPQAAVRDCLAVVVWEGRGSENHSQIFAVYSTDYGVTWSSAISVSDDPEHAQWQPTVSIAPDLTVEVVWQDQREETPKLYRASGTLDESSFAPRMPNTIPDEISLTAYPNPFNPSTTISLSLQSQRSVSLDVIDVNGRSVELIAKSSLHAGTHNFRFNGHGLSSGTYFIRVRSDGYQRGMKLVLLR